MTKRRKSRSETARNLGAIRSTGNKTEEALRKRLHAGGLRYRMYVGGLPGKPDIVFKGARVAVFVDGDYWHGRLLIEEGWGAVAAKFRHLSKKSRAYWREKLSHRVLRDRQVTADLRAMG